MHMHTKRSILAAVIVAALFPSVAAAQAPAGAKFATIKDGRTLTVLTASGATDVPLGINAVDAMGNPTGNTLAPGENIVGIDVRPRTGQLFGLSTTNQVYVIDPSTGTTTKVGTPFATPLAGKVGFDVNPSVDRLRVTTSTDQNLRLNPDTGALAATDGPLAYAATDRHAGLDPNIVENGYTYRAFGSPGTRLFDIDSARQLLALQSPPNDGTLTSTGALRVDIAGTRAGFDIPGTDPNSTKGFGLFVVDGITRIYEVNVDTGVASPTGIAVPGGSYDGLTGLSGFDGPPPAA